MVLNPERSEGSPVLERRGSIAAVAAQDMKPELSIVIVTWNSERWIVRCLNSIPAACEGLPYEIVVRDNSNDNIGFAAAVNRAIASVRGEYVFLLNPDSELGPR